MTAVRRSRLRRVRRWSLSEVLIGDGLERLPRDAYAALRDDLLERFADRLELLEPLWRFEPGVPVWLRELPEPGDLRLRDDAAIATADTARAAVLAGRRRWLADHGYPASAPVPSHPVGGDER